MASYKTMNFLTIGEDTYEVADEAARGSVELLMSQYSNSGSNLLDPSNCEIGYRVYDNDTGELTKDDITNENRRRTISPIELPEGGWYLYVRTTLSDMPEDDTNNLCIHWLDSDGKCLGTVTTRLRFIANSEIGYYQSTSIPNSSDRGYCTHIHVEITGAKPANGGYSFDQFCISREYIPEFEQYGKLDSSVHTAGMKLLIFGDSATETDTMDETGGNYVANVRTNWPTFASRMLQASEVRNYAKSGATCRDTGYEYDETGTLVPKNEEVVVRLNLSEQIDMALANTGYVPDVVVIAIGTNDTAAILDALNPESATETTTVCDTYEDAMSIGSLTEFNYDVRTTMHKALRYAMWSIRTAYPNAKCFASIPIQRTHVDIPAYTIEAITAMAHRYGFVVIDSYSESGILGENWSGNSECTDIDVPYDLYDGLHPTLQGSHKLAELIAAKIFEYTRFMRV